MALFFVLNSPELEILGITTVAGNRSLNVATADALKILEVTNRTRDPGVPGRGRAVAAPGDRVGHQAAWRLVRERAGAGAARWLRERRRLEARSAVDFLVEHRDAEPGAGDDPRASAR